MEGHPIRAAVGIHIGGLMVGIVGEEERMQGTVISDAVNIASRLQGLTRKYGCPILVSEQTLQGVQFPDSFHARLVDKVRMRGKTALTTVYEIFDGDDPALFESKLSTLAQYEEGLNLFHARDFSGAHKRLSEVVQKSPSDSLAVMYLERAAAGIRGKYPRSGRESSGGAKRAHWFLTLAYSVMGCGWCKALTGAKHIFI